MGDYRVYYIDSDDDTKYKFFPDMEQKGSCQCHEHQQE